MKTSVRALILGVSILLGGVPVAAADLSGTARIDTLLWNCEIRGNGATLTVHRRCTVTHAGGKDFAWLDISETPFEKVQNLTVMVLDATGRTVKKYSKKDLTRQCGYGESYELYSDHCEYYREPYAGNFPYTIVMDYVKEYSSLFFLPDVGIADAIPTGYAQVDISCEAVNPVSIKQNDLTLEDVTSTAGGKIFHHLVIRNLPAAKEISFVPIQNLGGRAILLAPHAFKLSDYGMNQPTWRDMGRFYYEMARDRYLPVADSTVKPADHASAVAAANRLYEEVAGKIRYLAISIGISGWQPQAASRTDQLGYGDCKAVATLLVSKLRQAGITAYSCLVKTRDQGSLDSSFVASVFNHVIAVAIIDSDTLFYDATCRTCPAGVIRDDDEGLLVLVSTDSGGVLVSTPMLPAERNLLVRRAHLTFSDTVPPRIDISADMLGHFASDWRASLKGEEREAFKEDIKGFFVGSASPLKLTASSQENLDSLHLPYRISATMLGQRVIDKVGAYRFALPFEFTSRQWYDQIDFTDRKIGVNLGSPRLIVDTVVMTTAWSVPCDSVRLPQGDSLSFSGGFVAASYRKEGDTVIGVLRQEFSQSSVPVEKLGEFEKFLANRKRVLDRPIKWYLGGK